MKNTGDPGSRGATLVAPNKYSGEAVGLMCVCYGNTQPETQLFLLSSGTS